MKHKRYIRAFFATLGFLLVGLISFMRPDWLLLPATLTWLSGYFLLLLLFMPVGRIRLGVRTSASLSFVGWFLRVMVSQLALGVVTLAAALAFFMHGPAFIESPVPLEFMTNALAKYRTQWGLFPWGMYGLWGLTVAYVVYLKKGPPYLYSIAYNFCPKRFEPMVKTCTEGACSGATFMAFGLTVTAIILLISYSFESAFNISHFYVPIIFVTLLSFFGYALVLKFGRQLFRRLLNRHKTLNQIYTLYIVALVPIVIGSAFANQWFISRQPEIYKMSTCYKCGNFFANIPLEIRFAAMYWGWWLAWTPIVGSYLAKISQGRSIREWVVGILCVPLVLFFISHVGQPKMLLLWVHELSPLSWSLILFVLALTTWAILYQIVKSRDNTDIFISGLMPVGIRKRSRLWLTQESKAVGVSRYEPKLLMTILGTLLLHTMAGWYGIQFQVAAMGIYVFWVIYNAFYLLVFQFFKDKAWMGSNTISSF